MGIFFPMFSWRKRKEESEIDGADIFQSSIFLVIMVFVVSDMNRR